MSAKTCLLILCYLTVIDLHEATKANEQHSFLSTHQRPASEADLGNDVQAILLRRKRAEEIKQVETTTEVELMSDSVSLEEDTQNVTSQENELELSDTPSKRRLLDNKWRWKNQKRTRKSKKGKDRGGKKGRRDRGRARTESGFQDLIPHKQRRSKQRTLEVPRSTPVSAKRTLNHKQWKNNTIKGRNFCFPLMCPPPPPPTPVFPSSYQGRVINRPCFFSSCAEYRVIQQPMPPIQGYPQRQQSHGLVTQIFGIFLGQGESSQPMQVPLPMHTFGNPCYCEVVACPCIVDAVIPIDTYSAEYSPQNMAEPTKLAMSCDPSALCTPAPSCSGSCLAAAIRGNNLYKSCICYAKGHCVCFLAPEVAPEETRVVQQIVEVIEPEKGQLKGDINLDNYFKQQQSPSRG